jgi:hypothetical protein
MALEEDRPPAPDIAVLEAMIAAGEVERAAGDVMK